MTNNSQPPEDQTVFKSTEIYKTQSQQKVLPPQQPKENKLKKYKLPIIFGAAGLLLIIIIVVVAIVLINADSQSTEESTTNETDTEQISTDEVYDLDATDATDRAEAIAAFDAEIAAATDAEMQADLYQDRAAYLYAQLGLADEAAQAEMQEQILADALAAEELLGTTASAYNVYFYESTFGNAETAAEYLQIVKERDPNYTTNTEGAG